MWGKLPKQWPVIIFGVALFLLSVCFVASKPVAENWLCSTEERSVAVCTRNWVNAAGNIFTFAVAVAAAIFGFRQWQASNSQASRALLPTLEALLIDASALYKIEERLQGSLYAVMQLLGLVHLYLDEKVYSKAIGEAAKNVVNALDSHKNVRTEMRDYAADPRHEDDLIRQAERCLEASDLRSLHALRMIIEGCEQYVRDTARGFSVTAASAEEGLFSCSMYWVDGMADGAARIKRLRAISKKTHESIVIVKARRRKIILGS